MGGEPTFATDLVVPRDDPRLGVELDARVVGLAVLAHDRFVVAHLFVGLDVCMSKTVREYIL